MLIVNKLNQILYIVNLFEGTELQFSGARDPNNRQRNNDKFQKRHPIEIKTWLKRSRMITGLNTST